MLSASSARSRASKLFALWRAGESRPALNFLTGGMGLLRRSVSAPGGGMPMSRVNDRSSLKRAARTAIVFLAAGALTLSSVADGFARSMGSGGGGGGRVMGGDGMRSPGGGGRYPGNDGPRYPGGGGGSAPPSDQTSRQAVTGTRWRQPGSALARFARLPRQP